MSLPIKMTMLGGSQTGKTCYLVGMYGMMRRGIKGFTFTTVDPDEDLELAASWKTMRNTTGETRWPAPTTESTDREFDFCYGYKPYRRFIWHDYRGGAIYSPERSDPDAQKLAEQLVESSCVMFCFSAAHMTDPLNRIGEQGADAIELTEDGEDEVARLNVLVGSVARKAHATCRPLPTVVIVLTKYDMISTWPRDAVLEKVRQLFSPLFSEGGGWTVTICPVSLGKALAGNRDHGEVVGLNLHLPVTFAVYCSIQQSVAQARARHAANVARMQAAADKHALQRWWEGIDLSSHETEVQRTQSEYSELSARLNLLFQELVQGLRIFHDGRESKFHD